MSSTKLMKWALLVAAASGLAASNASATVIATIVTQGVNPKDNFGDSSSGFTAYIIRLVTNDGATITAVDAGGGLTNATNGIFGPMLQNWDISVDRGGNTTEAPTPVEADQFTPLAPHSIDSHFLVPAVARADTNTPVEDNTGANPPGSPPDFPGNNGSDFGTGSFLQATFGIQAANQATTLDLAYIVLPTGVLGSYSLDVADSNDQGYHLAGVIPEPGTAGLFMVGLGLLFGRRKK